MKKLIIVLLLAVIGVLAPCVVEVNFNQKYIEDAVSVVCEFSSHTETEAHEARGRVTIAQAAKQNFKKLVVIVTKANVWHDDYGEKLKHEQRRTYLFYARQAGGLPSGNLSI